MFSSQSYKNYVFDVSQSYKNYVFDVSYFFFGDTLTFNNIPFGVMLCNLSFIFDHPIICKIIK